MKEVMKLYLDEKAFTKYSKMSTRAHIKNVLSGQNFSNYNGLMGTNSMKDNYRKTIRTITSYNSTDFKVDDLLSKSRNYDSHKMIHSISNFDNSISTLKDNTYFPVNNTFRSKSRISSMDYELPLLNTLNANSPDDMRRDSNFIEAVRQGTNPSKERTKNLVLGLQKNRQSHSRNIGSQPNIENHLLKTPHQESNSQNNYLPHRSEAKTQGRPSRVVNIINNQNPSSDKDFKFKLNINQYDIQYIVPKNKGVKSNREVQSNMLEMTDDSKITLQKQLAQLDDLDNLSDSYSIKTYVSEGETKNPTSQNPSKRVSVSKGLSKDKLRLKIDAIPRNCEKHLTLSKPNNNQPSTALFRTILKRNKSKKVISIDSNDFQQLKTEMSSKDIKLNNTSEKQNKDKTSNMIYNRANKNSKTLLSPKGQTKIKNLVALRSFNHQILKKLETINSVCNKTAGSRITFGKNSEKDRCHGSSSENSDVISGYDKNKFILGSDSGSPLKSRILKDSPHRSDYKNGKFQRGKNKLFVEKGIIEQIEDHKSEYSESQQSNHGIRRIGSEQIGMNKSNKLQFSFSVNQIHKKKSHNTIAHDDNINSDFSNGKSIFKRGLLKIDKNKMSDDSVSVDAINSFMQSDSDHSGKYKFSKKRSKRIKDSEPNENVGVYIKQRVSCIIKDIITGYDSDSKTKQKSSKKPKTKKSIAFKSSDIMNSIKQARKMFPMSSRNSDDSFRRFELNDEVTETALMDFDSHQISNINQTEFKDEKEAKLHAVNISRVDYKEALKLKSLNFINSKVKTESSNIQAAVRKFKNLLFYKANLKAMYKQHIFSIINSKEMLPLVLSKDYIDKVLIGRERKEYMMEQYLDVYKHMLKNPSVESNPNEDFISPEAPLTIFENFCNSCEEEGINNSPRSFYRKRAASDFDERRLKIINSGFINSLIIRDSAQVNDREKMVQFLAHETSSSDSDSEGEIKKVSTTLNFMRHHSIFCVYKVLYRFFQQEVRPHFTKSSRGGNVGRG